MNQPRSVPTEDLLGPLNEVERKHAPARLFYAGDPGVLDVGPRVSIVGSRKASSSGLETARVLADWLAGRGVVVVSGLAEGIDTVAHETSIAARGRTIAVLGTPLDQAYPTQNRALQERIIREHLAVSQFPPGSRVRRENFPIRNRTMALMSHATIIVEAGEKSGSLHQGWEALRLGRPLFVLESLLEDLALAWPREMARYGALTLTLAELDPISEYLPTRGRADLSQVAF